MSSNSLKFSTNSHRNGFQEQIDSSGSKKDQENNDKAESFSDASPNRNSDSSFSENLQTFKDSLKKISDEVIYLLLHFAKINNTKVNKKKYQDKKDNQFVTKLFLSMETKILTNMIKLFFTLLDFVFE